MLKELVNEIERVNGSIVVLRDPVADDYVPVSVMAAEIGLSGRRMNEMLEKAGIITKQKIVFKRPIERVRHPKRYKWLVMPKYRHILEDGLASENCGPYKHSICWRNCEQIKNLFENLKRHYS